MKICVGHSREFNFEEYLYKPLLELGEELDIEFVLPHEGNTYNNSRETTRECDVMVAEISYPSTGMGIEIGWVNDLGKPIICLIKKGFNISDSIRTVTDKFVEYGDESELKVGLKNFLEGIK